MFLLLLTTGLSLAAAPTCEGTPEEWLETLTAAPDRAAYVCLGYVDAAHDPLVAAASAEPVDDDVGRRLSRALAVHLMLHLDRPITPEESRILNGADRRLLSDAIYARRGRRTPSAAHAEVFAAFDWYQPDDRFNNSRLTELDRANLAMVAHPPDPPPAQATAADAVAQSNNRPTVPQGMCGCSARGASLSLGAAAFALLVGLRRRRRRGP